MDISMMRMVDSEPEQGEGHQHYMIGVYVSPLSGETNCSWHSPDESKLSKMVQA